MKGKLRRSGRKISIGKQIWEEHLGNHHLTFKGGGGVMFIIRGKKQVTKFYGKQSIDLDLKDVKMIIIIWPFSILWEILVNLKNNYRFFMSKNKNNNLILFFHAKKTIWLEWKKMDLILHDQICLNIQKVCLTWTLHDQLYYSDLYLEKSKTTTNVPNSRNKIADTFTLVKSLTNFLIQKLVDSWCRFSLLNTIDNL